MTGRLEMHTKLTLRPDEVARMFSCSKQHIYNLVEEGSLRGADVKSAICRKPALRILTSSVEEFLERRKI